MDNEKIGNFIREQRTSHDLTQKELADKLNCTDKAISRWETGKGSPDVSLLIPLSNELGVSVNEILLGELIAKEEQIEKMEETIVSTITESKKEISKISKILYFSLAVAEALTICALAFADSEGPIFALMPIIITILNSIIIGLTKLDLKYKYIFPVIIAIEVFTGFVLVNSANDGMLYSAIHLALSIIFILISSGIKKATSLVFKK